MREKVPWKMALVRGILLWLPVGRLTKIFPDATLQSLLPERAQAVNGYSREELAAFLVDPIFEFPASAPDWWRYLALCTYQGELSEYGPIFLRTSLLQARALKLGDRAAFFRFSSMNNDQSYYVPDEALIGNDPAIQATVLAFWPRVNLLSTEGIRRTPGLLAAMRERVLEQPGDWALRLQFQLEPLKTLETLTEKNPKGWLPGLKIWLEAAAADDPEGRTGMSPEEIASLFQRGGMLDPIDINETLAGLGVTDFLQPAARGNSNRIALVALEAVRPKVLIWLLRRGFLSPWTYQIMPTPQSVDTGYLQRVQATLSLLAEHREMFQFFPAGYYTSILQIFLGQKLPDEVLAEADADMLKRMIQVAHPQLPLTLPRFPANFEPFVHHSTVLYDVDRLLQVIPAKPGTYRNYTMEAVYAYGKLMRNRQFYQRVLGTTAKGWQDQVSIHWSDNNLLHSAELLELMQRYGTPFPYNWHPKGPIETPLMRAFYRDPERFQEEEREADGMMVRWREYYRLLVS